MPLDVGQAAPIYRAGQEAAALEIPLAPAQRDHLAEEPEDVALLLAREIPVEPADLVVLAVGVVVALLRAADLVAGDEHRRPLREEQDRSEVLDLSLAERIDPRGVRRAFHAVVPADVVVHPVTVALAVRIVVLRVVRDEVVEGETIVGGDEVDAVRGAARLALIDVRAAGDPCGDRRDQPAVAAHELPDVIAEPSIPL